VEVDRAMCNGSCKLAVIKTDSPVPPERDLLPEQKMYRPFFDLVAPKDNWKNPIYVRIAAPQSREDRRLFKEMITRAVEFFAGCTPHITDVGEEKITVRAAGYYKAVGA
jgi:hypothetical protein